MPHDQRSARGVLELHPKGYGFLRDPARHIAQAVAKNHPEMHLMVLLIDERPEEVTEMRRTIRGEVFASSSDRDSVSHARLAELVMERAKRLAEQGRQSFVLLDSITRLAR